MTIQKEFTLEHYLTAAECNAACEIPMPLLVQRVIDVATAHANFLGFGYVCLQAQGKAWVLSRLSIELKRVPMVSESLRFNTWVEDINRLFSERIVEITDADGKIYGYARTNWAAIDVATRRPTDLHLLLPQEVINTRECPIDGHPRLVAVGQPDSVATYTFRYSDIDFNRHVNSTRYVALMLDSWDMEFFDKNRIERFDVAFLAEAHCGDTVEVRVKTTDDAAVSELEIAREGVTCTRARVKFSPRV